MTAAAILVASGYLVKVGRPAGSDFTYTSESRFSFLPRPVFLLADIRDLLRRFERLQGCRSDGLKVGPAQGIFEGNLKRYTRIITLVF